MRQEGHYLQLLYRLKAAGSVNMGAFMRDTPTADWDLAAEAMRELMQLPEVTWDGEVNGTLTWNEKSSR